ncbi:aspartate carbamoyltransferase catalytic subunit [Candidatus Gracilibacteria bacterium]|nr:aspartate carbamoyltransferase catalytic subunit [Candidatus Gracilibacteria bacterium]
MDAQTFEKKLTQKRRGQCLSCTDLISIEDLSKKDIEMIFDLASSVEELLKGDMKKIGLLKGKTQINFFMENSTRTRSSFELAGKNLGADTINISGDSSSMQKGETLLDTAITMDQMQPDIIVIRSADSGSAKFFAKNVKAAVINAGDGWNEHPTQALLDLYTIIKSKGKNLKGKKLVIVGDVLHSRVFGSLWRIAKMFELSVTVCAPYTLIPANLEDLKIKHEPDIEKALVDADIVYTLRLQTERAAASYVPTLREYSKTYIINAKRMLLAKKDAIVMHPGPVIRELDVHTNILESEKSVIPYQVFSGYCVRFVLLWLLGENRKNKTVEKRLYKPF